MTILVGAWVNEHAGAWTRRAALTAVESTSRAKASSF